MIPYGRVCKTAVEREAKKALASGSARKRLSGLLGLIWDLYTRLSELEDLLDLREVPMGLVTPNRLDHI